MKFNIKNYEEYALEYLEGSLMESEQREYAAFLLLHPEIQEELESFELVTIAPDTSQVFTEKENLYRKSGNGLYRVVAGLALIACLIFVLFWTKNENPIQSESVQIISAVPKVEEPTQRTNAKEDIAQIVQMEKNEKKAPIMQTASSIVKPNGVEDIKSKIEKDLPTVTDKKFTNAVAHPDEVTSEGEIVFEQAGLERQNWPISFMPALKSIQKIPKRWRKEKIEIIHPALIRAFIDLEKEESQSKVGKWLTQVKLIPSTFDRSDRSEIKNKILPTYFSAE